MHRFLGGYVITGTWARELLQDRKTKGRIFRLLPGICDIVRVQKKLPGLSPALRSSETADSQEWLSHLPRNKGHEASCPTREMLG